MNDAGKEYEALSHEVKRMTMETQRLNSKLTMVLVIVILLFVLDLLSLVSFPLFNLVNAVR